MVGDGGRWWEMVGERGDRGEVTHLWADEESCSRVARPPLAATTRTEEACV